MSETTYYQRNKVVISQIEQKIIMNITKKY